MKFRVFKKNANALCRAVFAYDPDGNICAGRFASPVSRNRVCTLWKFLTGTSIRSKLEPHDKDRFVILRTAEKDFRPMHYEASQGFEIRRYGQKSNDRIRQIRKAMGKGAAYAG